jgi:hypothetical protein
MIAALTSPGAERGNCYNDEHDAGGQHAQRRPEGDQGIENISTGHQPGEHRDEQRDPHEPPDQPPCHGSKHHRTAGSEAPANSTAGDAGAVVAPNPRRWSIISKPRPPPS